jgi:uncharacterized membrane protein YhaH (DUF805 family)
MRVALVPLDGGPRVPISSWRGLTESYSVTGHEGQAAMYATVSRTGRYGLTAQNVVPGTITDIAVGRGIGHGALISLLLFAAGLFVLLPAGLVVGGVTAARRRRARRSLLQEPMQPMGSAGPEVAVPSPSQPDQPEPYPPSPPLPPYPPYPPGAPLPPYPPSPPLPPYPPGAQLAAPATYLQGSPVGFGEAIQQAFRNGFVYRGRASRSAYWWFVLFQAIAGLALEFVIFLPLAIINNSGVSSAALIAVSIVFIYLGLVTLALLVRRLHDIDRSGWWVLIGLVPVAGPITLFVYTVLEGTPGPNRYRP